MPHRLGHSAWLKLEATLHLQHVRLLQNVHTNGLRHEAWKEFEGPQPEMKMDWEPRVSHISGPVLRSPNEKPATT